MHFPPRNGFLNSAFKSIRPGRMIAASLGVPAKSRTKNHAEKAEGGIKCHTFAWERLKCHIFGGEILFQSHLMLLVHLSVCVYLVGG